jgi:hypothetical protein
MCNPQSLSGLLGCLLRSLALSVFYKKSFGPQTAPLVALLFLMQLNAVAMMIVFGAMFFVITSRLGREHMDTFCSVMASLSVQTVVVYFALMSDVMQQPRADIPWSKIMLASAVQFLRRPKSLRVALQDTRARFGPVYCVYVLASAKSPCLITAAICSTLAGTFFRPDNKYLMQMLVPSISYRKLKTLHQCFMLSSFACFVISLLLGGIHRF